MGVIQPHQYIRLTDAMELMAVQAAAEVASKHLSQRDTALAKAIAQETVKLLAKSFKGKR